MNAAYTVLSFTTVVTAINPAIMGWINLGISIYSTWRLYKWLNTEPVVY